MRTKLLISCFVLSGCATAGMGVGETKVAGVQKETVAFEYRQSNPEHARLIAVTEDGDRFVGHFTQFVTPVAQHLRPAMTPDRRWVGWLVSEAPPAAGKPKLYTGEGVGLMRDDHGGELVCQLTLVDGARGLARGGRGECATRDGQQIEATFPGKG